METLRGVGCTVGDYAGDGRGEIEVPVDTAVDDMVDTEPMELQFSTEDKEDGSSGDMDESRPLLTLFDLETTGFRVYSEHITDIGAKIINSPVPIPNPTFSSLVRTSRTIPPKGK